MPSKIKHDFFSKFRAVHGPDKPSEINKENTPPLTFKSDANSDPKPTPMTDSNPENIKSPDKPKLISMDDEMDQNPTLPTTPNSTNRRRSSRPTTPNNLDTSISPKPPRKKLTEEEKEARKLEREKQREAKKLADKAEKEKRAAERKAQQDADRKKKEAEKKAKQEADKLEREKRRAIEKQERDAKKEAEKAAREAEREAAKKLKEEEKKAEEERKEKERILQEERQKLKLEKKKQKHFGMFLKIGSENAKLRKKIQSEITPFMFLFQKRKFNVNPSDRYSKYVINHFNTEGDFNYEIKDGNCNYLTERKNIKIVGTGFKLRVLEKHKDREVVCLEDPIPSPTHPKCFYKYKTCKRYYYGTTSKFRDALGSYTSKIARNPFQKLDQLMARNHFELDYDYDSEYEWENEPSDAESCASVSDLGDDCIDDKFEENDEFCVPHGYLSDDEDGHGQAVAENNLNYKKKKIKKLIPQVIIYKKSEVGSEMETDDRASSSNNSSPEKNFLDFDKNFHIISRLNKVGIAMALTRHTTVCPNIKVSTKSKDLKKVEDLRVALSKTKIGKLPAKAIPKKADESGKAKASFPCMDSLCQLVHMNPMSKDVIIDEFRMFLEEQRYKKEIPPYTLPSDSMIKKRIGKIASHKAKPQTSENVGKMKFWQVKDFILDRYYGEDNYCESWQWFFPSNKDRYHELITKENERIQKRIKIEQARKERERKKELKMNRSRPTTPVSKSILISDLGQSFQTNPESEKRKNGDPLPASKRVKLESDGPIISPVTPVGNMLKYMKIQSKEERINAIKNCPENLNPEIVFVKPDANRTVSPSQEDRKFGLPTQAGINKLFSSCKNLNSTENDSKSS